MSRNKKPIAIIIGAGIGGLATSILLAKRGYQVVIYEKLASVGGRARQFKTKGFTFDMGPSWYLMPRVFEQFYSLIGEDIHAHLKLKRLAPAYKVFFEDADPITIQGDLSQDTAVFDRIEQGAGEALQKYVSRAEKTYKLAVDSFLYTNFESYRPFARKDIIKSGPFMLRSAVQPIDQYVSSFVKDQRLKQILEYPMVFLGASPYNAPALYHLMSYMDFVEGVFYPEGGLFGIIRSLESIARKNGVTFHCNAPVEEILVTHGIARGIKLIDGSEVGAELVVSNADLHHTETSLLAEGLRSYPARYWDKRKAGPSAMLFYLGIKGKLPVLTHHNLFFTKDWKQNFSDIFDTKSWPEPASIYVSKPSETDPTIAPKDHENVFILVPLPARSMTRAEQRMLEERYLAQFKQLANIPDLEKRLVYKRVYTPNDFAAELNAWQGTALGLSHTLRQSAVFRPRNKSRKVRGLYYVGGNTIPGIGLPMCLIGAELVYKHITGDRSNTPLERLERME